MKRMSLATVIAAILVLSVGVAAAQTPPAPRPAPANPPAQIPPTLPTTTPAKPATPPAAPAPFPAEAKFAFVNMQTIVAESKLGKQGQDQMKALHDKNQTALSARGKSIQDLQQQIQSQQG